MEKMISRQTGNVICRCPEDGQWQSPKVCSTCPHFQGHIDGNPICGLEKGKKKELYYIKCKKCGFSICTSRIQGALELVERIHPCGCINPFYEWELDVELPYEPDLDLDVYIKKIRRRIEDRLRKSNPETILKIAKELRVNMTF